MKNKHREYSVRFIKMRIYFFSSVLFDESRVYGKAIRWESFFLVYTIRAPIIEELITNSSRLNRIPQIIPPLPPKRTRKRCINYALYLIIFANSNSISHKVWRFYKKYFKYLSLKEFCYFLSQKKKKVLIFKILRIFIPTRFQ